MTFDPAFLSMMSTTATYFPFDANNGYGEPSFGATVAFVCHVTYKKVIIRSDTEEDRTSSAQLQAPPPGWVVNGITTPTVTIYDRVTLPFDGIQRKVLDVKTFTDETGVHHQSLSLE